MKNGPPQLIQPKISQVLLFLSVVLILPYAGFKQYGGVWHRSQSAEKDEKRSMQSTERPKQLKLMT